MLKRSILSLLTTFIIAAQIIAADAVMAPPEPAGMKTIFNGKDLSGWDGDPRLWSVKDGAIRGETTEEIRAEGNTFIIWQGGRVKDFELRLSFRCNATNNSGIQYRSKHVTEGNVRNKWVVRGYQHEIRNELALPSVSGFIYDEGGGRGRLCLVGEKLTYGADGKKTVSESLIDQDAFNKLFKLDGWNDVVIIAKGNHIQHYLNGRLVVDFTDAHPGSALSEGILALQLHAGKPMWAEYKDIRVKAYESAPELTTQARRMVDQFLKNLEPAGLTADQKNQIEVLFGSVANTVSEKREKAGITNQIQQQRFAAGKAAREAGKKGADVLQAVAEKLGLTEAQVTCIQETDQSLAQVKREIGQLLTAEQLAKIQDGQLKTSLEQKGKGKKRKAA